MSKSDWEQAIIAGKGLIKQGLIIIIQGEGLIERAKKELKKFKNG